MSAAIQEVEGPYPSPTLLIDGADVTGQRLSSEPACRLIVPSADEIVRAILAAGQGELAGLPGGSE